MKITYYGHACFSVATAGKVLLFDPFIRPNPLARNIDLRRVPADYILISHGHEDHIADALDLAKSTGATVVSNFEIVEWLLKAGAPNGHPLNLGGSVKLEVGRVKFVPALHSSSLPDGTYGGNPGGFVVETTGGNFYYSGDTALTMEMKLIGESTALRFAALPIGDNFTMGVDDAIKAAAFVRCQNIFGIHYDTFPPIRIDHEEAIRKFKAAGKQLHLAPIGGTLEL